MVVIFCLNDGDRIIGIQIQDIIGTLSFRTGIYISAQDDLAVRNSGFHRDLGMAPLLRDSGRDIVVLNIFLCHILFGNDRFHRKRPFLQPPLI